MRCSSDSTAILTEQEEGSGHEAHELGTLFMLANALSLFIQLPRKDSEILYLVCSSNLHRFTYLEI